MGADVYDFPRAAITPDEVEQKLVECIERHEAATAVYETLGQEVARAKVAHETEFSRARLKSNAKTDKLRDDYARVATEQLALKRETTAERYRAQGKVLDLCRSNTDGWRSISASIRAQT